MNAAITPDTCALDWDCIFREYHHRIRGFIRLRVRDFDVVDDLTQEVFTRAIDAAQRGKGPHIAPQPWLFQIARNLCTDWYRMQGRVTLADYDDLTGVPVGDLTPHELAEQAITSQRVRSAIASLTHHQERVTTLRMDGYEYEEIATEIGKSHGATKALQHRSYVELQRHLKGAA